MPKEIAFQPGRFTPVVEVAQRDSGLPAPAETSFAGLEEVSTTTLHIASAASRGYGSVTSDPVPIARTSMIIAYVLAARNIVEQLLHIGIHTRFTTPLRSATVTALEPIVRAYNYYGHFELDGKTFVTRDLEYFLIRNLFQLRSFATGPCATGSSYTERISQATLDNINFSLYFLNDEGEIEFGKRKPLREYLLDLVSYVHALPTLGTSATLVLLREILDISTENALTNFLRYARTIEEFVPPDRYTVPEPTPAHKAAMKELFGKEFSAPKATIPVSLFTGPITSAYQLLRRVSLEKSYVMKTIPLPKYEGGSASQLATVQDDILVSQVPLSLSDSTAAAAFTTCFGALRAYRSAPGIEQNELLAELVATSIIK